MFLRTSTIIFVIPYYFTITGDRRIVDGKQEASKHPPPSHTAAPPPPSPVRFPCVYQTKLILGAPALLPVSDTHPAVGGSSKLPSGFARYIPAPCGSSTYQ